MIYRDLFMFLQKLPDTELDLDVSVMNDEHEIFKCDSIVDTSDVNMEDVLECPHPIILM